MTALYIVLGVFAGVILIAILLRLAEHRRDKSKKDDTRYVIKTPRYEKKDVKPVASKETFDETHAHDAKGQKGERKMNKLLEEYCSNHPGSYLISGVIIPDSRGLTSDIDHILFAPVGVFVIETKNYHGVVTGSEQDKKWKLKIYGDVTEERPNGIRQNWSHIIALESHFKISKNRIHNCVVLIRDDSNGLSEDCKRFVFNFKDFPGYLETFKKVKIQPDKLKEYYQKIKYFKDNPPCTPEEHIEQMRKLHNEKRN